MSAHGQKAFHETFDKDLFDATTLPGPAASEALKRIMDNVGGFAQQTGGDPAAQREALRLLAGDKRFASIAERLKGDRSGLEAAKTLEQIQAGIGKGDWGQVAAQAFRAEAQQPRTLPNPHAGLAPAVTREAFNDFEAAKQTYLQLKDDQKTVKAIADPHDPRRVEAEKRLSDMQAELSKRSRGAEVLSSKGMDDALLATVNDGTPQARQAAAAKYNGSWTREALQKGDVAMAFYAAEMSPFVMRANDPAAQFEPGLDANRVKEAAAHATDREPARAGKAHAGDHTFQAQNFNRDLFAASKMGEPMASQALKRIMDNVGTIAQLSGKDADKQAALHQLVADPRFAEVMDRVKQSPGGLDAANNMRQMVYDIRNSEYGKAAASAYGVENKAPERMADAPQARETAARGQALSSGR